MDDAEKTHSDLPPEVDIADIQEMVRMLGQVVSNASLYGPTHKAVKLSLDTTYILLELILQHCGSLTLNTTDDSLLVDGREVDQSNPLVASFVRQLQLLELGGFTLSKGMTKEDLGKLLELLSLSPEKLRLMGSFGDILQKSGIQFVQSRAVTYKRVTEEDVVVNKGDLLDKIGGAGKSEAEVAEPELTKEDVEQGQRVLVDQIVAFLKGDVVPDRQKVIEGLSELTADASKLADLIMRTALVQQKAANLEGGESLADFVVGCIQKTYDVLMDQPHAKTQQGKKDLSKALMLLESSILDKLRSMTVVTDNALSAISTAVEDIDAELAIEAISAEYMKKRIALENTEAKVLRFIKKTEKRKPGTADVLKDKLMNGGLSLEGWKEIVMKSGAPGSRGMGRVGAGGPGGGSPPDGMRGIGMLAMLLSKLDEMMGTIKRTGSAEGNPEISKVVRELDQEVNQVVAKTEQKVEDLIATGKALDLIKDDEASAREAVAKIAQWKEDLAEIVQELCQLITVISSAIDMIRSGRLGDVSHDQAEMLSLASSSSDRLKHLTDKMLALSGVPASMEPDAKLLRSLFK